jgi:hypothetical protein
MDIYLYEMTWLCLLPFGPIGIIGVVFGHQSGIGWANLDVIRVVEYGPTGGPLASYGCSMGTGLVYSVILNKKTLVWTQSYVEMVQ